MSSAILVLEDGRTFSGRAYGKPGTTLGELVFATGMTGYQETLTDPSYAGQIVVQTAPHIGNTGVNSQDEESSRIWVAGYVVRDPSRMVSNFRAENSLDEELVKHSIVGISGLDTRALTRHLRSAGAMRAGIFSGEDAGKPEDELLEVVRGAKKMQGQSLSEVVSTSHSFVEQPKGQSVARVAIVDLGIKRSTIEHMLARNLTVEVYPADVTAEVLLSNNPDAVFYSNGPGDPEAVVGAPEHIRSLVDGGMPVFGICLGHQLLTLALGGTTFKLPFGHHGANHPVRNVRTGSVEITSQNHNFCVDPNSLSGIADITHTNLNDLTNEGMAVRGARAFSVQYHPEAGPGPHDSRYLFNEFRQLMEAK